jgi:DNA-binding MarR family transcriptional regulator
VGEPARAATSADEPGRSHETGLTRAGAIARTTALPIRVTHRTTLVLRAIAQTPYSNNREIAYAAGITDEGQASKLLARLERRGVIENVGVGPARGEPNAWLLTASGRRAVEVIGESFDGASRARQARVTDAG